MRLGNLLLHDPKQFKHLRKFAVTLGSHPLEARMPWLAFDVTDWLSTRLDRTSSVFEYGGGGSSAWFSDRVAHVVTAESSCEWADGLRSALAAADNIEILQAGPGGGYEEYVALIDSYEDASFDLVTVDGRERVRCVERAMSKVRPGGYILLDDSERPKYAAAMALMTEWEPLQFRGIAPWKSKAGHSTVWTKPAALVRHG